jgi:hypothetical protein
MIPSAKSLHFFTKIAKKTGILYQIVGFPQKVAGEFAMISSVIDEKSCVVIGGICG